MLTYTITEPDHCRRVESFLHNLLPQAPGSYLKKLIKSGHVTVNSTPTTPDTLLAISDTVSLKESSRLAEFLASRRPELDILFEDNRIIVFNKPAGLAMHRTAEDGEDNLVDRGERFFDRQGRPCTLRPVNRLDRGTSGVVILAKSATAAGMFGRLVKEVGLGKLYLAVVAGQLTGEGSINAQLDGKESETHYQCLATGADRTLLALFPTTGRTHQIRRHLQLIGHPILGDQRYGGIPLPRRGAFALHSFRTVLHHPETGKELVICAPLPPDFLSYVRQLSGNDCLQLLRSLPELPTVFIERTLDDNTQPHP